VLGKEPRSAPPEWRPKGAGAPILLPIRHPENCPFRAFRLHPAAPESAMSKRRSDPGYPEGRSGIAKMRTRGEDKLILRGSNIAFAAPSLPYSSRQGLRHRCGAEMRSISRTKRKFRRTATPSQPSTTTISITLLRQRAARICRYMPCSPTIIYV
jgi:hypothetical protein